MNTINVLWTGGLDSTFLVSKLSIMEGINIQPYYVVDTTRSSVNKELDAIKDITALIRCHPKYKAILCDVRLVNNDKIKDDKHIQDAWNKLHREYTLGSQYDFLARFAKQFNLKLAVGVLFSDRGKVARSIEGKCNLVGESINGIDFLRVESNEENDSMTVFENLLFPSFMRNMEKTDEWAELKNMGFEAIAKKTWFCHTPVFGMPCGHCNPCQDALHEGMAFRVPWQGWILYYFVKIYRKIFK